jgi:chromosomal replication initiation ATPase DnaA
VSLPRADRVRVTRIRLTRLGAYDVARAVCAEHCVDEERVFGGDRQAWPTAARHRIWMLLRHTLGLSYPEIAIMFDMDHTSIMNGVRRAEERAGLAVAS